MTTYEEIREQLKNIYIYNIYDSYITIGKNNHQVVNLSNGFNIDNISDRIKCIDNTVDIFLNLINNRFPDVKLFLFDRYGNSTIYTNDGKV